jgi:hypothetical protein
MAGNAAAAAAVDLSWLLVRLSEIRRIALATGFDYAKFPRTEYRERRGSALMRLRELKGYGEIAQQLAESTSNDLTSRL